jgi:hypothetical protein
MAVVVCEDLARMDPVSEVLRSVGPNLLIALLMDGPQIRGRWSWRYASVLAEDPGTSVLTVTSLGMSRLSQPSSGATDRSRTIALWRDKVFGEREIDLEDDAVGCVLSVVCQSAEELSIDGRPDDGEAHCPVFAGLHQVRVNGH